MRLNAFIASSSQLSRRAADRAINEGRVEINGQPAKPGSQVSQGDQVSLDGQLLEPRGQTQTIVLNKPVGYVCSRQGQGSQTIYDLLPADLSHLKPVGRLDKDSSGLLVMTDDGQLAHQLTHPSFEKAKVYEISLSKPLAPGDKDHISQSGVELEDGPSQLELDSPDQTGKKWQVTMTEGRNRQIRRTFEALGYQVTGLHRTHFGPYDLGNIKPAAFTAGRRLDP